MSEDRWYFADELIKLPGSGVSVVRICLDILKHESLLFIDVVFHVFLGSPFYTSTYDALEDSYMERFR